MLAATGRNDVFPVRRHLREARIREQPFRREARAESHRPAPPWEEEVVCLLARERGLTVEQVSGVVFLGDLVSARQILHAERAGEAEPLAGFVDRRPIVLRLAGLGVFVPMRHAKVQAFFVRPRQRNAIARRKSLQPLRIVDVGLELVPAVVHPATLQPDLHARPRIRAHVSA